MGSAQGKEAPREEKGTFLIPQELGGEWMGGRAWNLGGRETDPPGGRGRRGGGLEVLASVRTRLPWAQGPAS